uniref:Tryptophan synthase alpha chain n=1 Tax=Sciadococcus taiwanensis TaxID=3028030 RepID=A0A9Y1MXH1_9RHOD|nr:tryptophan synthase alpha subunit [Sciadococcus taiwanensis]
MSEISKVFSNLHPKCALIPFIVAGYPNIQTSAQAIRIFDNLGADIIEVGLPYADPLADGPVIQEASIQALRQGIKIEDIFQMFEKLQNSIKAPIVLFSYYNIIINYGISNFISKLKTLGIKGLLVPDLPLEEANFLLNYAYKANIEIILLISPTSSKARMKMISNNSEGFIYLVSSTGVTGMREDFQGKLPYLIQEIKQITTKPVAVGFGISNKVHAEQIKSWGADGIIIGSACVKILSIADTNDAIAKLSNFITEIKQSI